MSHPIHRAAGSAPARTVQTETGFWGLDLASAALGRAFSRAADTENLIWEGEALRARPGYRELASFGARINGIFFYDDTLLIHAGSCLYRQDAAFESEPELLYSKMNDAPSQGVLRRQTVVARLCENQYLYAWRREQISGSFLFISDGLHYLFYDGTAVRPVADEYWGQAVLPLVSEGICPVYYATVPFTAVAKLPAAGTGDIDPRGANRLSQFRCESFYIDDTAPVTDYILSCPFGAYLEGIPVELQIRGEEGSWRNVNIESRIDVLRSGELTKLSLVAAAVQGGMKFSVDSDGRIVNLGVGIHQVANDGMDNVRLTYAVITDPPDALTGATVQGLYGADGADDVLFLGGSAAAPGEDAFSARNDFFCFYESSFERLGSSQTPVTGYCRLSDGRLAVLKDDPDGSAVFFRSHTVVTLGATQSGEAYQADAYPSRAGAAVDGCRTPFSTGIAGNEPCFLAKTGIYSVRSVSNELTNLNETVERSAPVQPLLEELDAADARSVCWRRYYLLCFGKIALITDGKRDSAGSYRFLKWRFSHAMSALAQSRGQLYLGSTEGKLYLLEETGTDASLPFEAFWQTPLLEEKSSRRLLLRKIYAAATPGFGAVLQARLEQEGGTLGTVSIALGRPDFACWDFGAVSFDGSGRPRWFSLPGRSHAADAFSMLFSLPKSEQFLLWGVRMIYEKGGMLK